MALEMLLQVKVLLVSRGFLEEQDRWFFSKASS
jgi:hypothetical protein